MMTINNGNGAASNTQTVRYNMNGQTDSVSKNIQDQIMNAQKQLQELGADKNMTPEEKMKKRQEIQQEITNLNQQLRQHQIEQRKEQQSQNASAKEDKKANSNTDTAKQGTGFSAASMEVIISADSTMKQAKVQGSVATQMKDRAGVLETEIKLDGARGGDTSAKEAELAEVEKKAENAENAQLNTLAEANQTMAEAAQTDMEDNDTIAKKKDDNADDDEQQAGEISDNADENTDIKTAVQTSEVSTLQENTTDAKPAPKKHINVYM